MHRVENQAVSKNNQSEILPGDGHLGKAPASGLSLDEQDASLVKGMLARGDRQHDIAAWFGVNGGRIAEISTGARFRNVKVATHDKLPPSGPYISGRDAHAAVGALQHVRNVLEQATRECEKVLSSIAAGDK